MNFNQNPRSFKEEERNKLILKISMEIQRIKYIPFFKSIENNKAGELNYTIIKTRDIKLQ